MIILSLLTQRQMEARHQRLTNADMTLEPPKLAELHAYAEKDGVSLYSCY